MDNRRTDEPSETIADEAVFDVALVRGGGRRPSAIVGLGIALAVGGLALAGTLDPRGSTAPDDVTSGAAGVPATSMRDVAAQRVVPEATSPAEARPWPGLVSPLLAIHTRAWGRHLIVRGEVFSVDAVIVVVSIRDATGGVLQGKTLVIPTGSTAFGRGTNDRFQLAFELEGVAAREVAWVEANAYDGAGWAIASEEQRLNPPSDPGWWRSEPAG